MPSRSLTLTAPNADLSRLTFFRFGRVGAHIVVSTDAGSLLVLDDDEFAALLGSGGDGQLHGELTRDGFDIDAYSRVLRRRAAFLGQGPTHHRLVMAGRVTGPYSPWGNELAPMPLDTVRASIDHALQSTASELTLTLTAADVAPHLEAIRFAYEYAAEKNKYERKVLRFELETSGAGVTQELYKELAEREVLVRLRVDGPADVHDALHGAGALAALSGSLTTADVLPALEAETWVTSKLVSSPSGLVEVLSSLGIQRFRLKASQPGLTPPALAVSAETVSQVRVKLVDALVESDSSVLELGALELAGRLFGGLSPSRPGDRSPAGDGTGRLVYAPDGQLFPSDDAYCLFLAGDERFELTNALSATLDETLAHPTLRALEVASLKDSQPGCSDCWNRPFCGTSPVRTFLAAGDIFLTRLSDPQCVASLRLAEHLVARRGEGGTTAAALERWASLAQQS